jgi:hypothetical protein
VSGVLIGVLTSVLDVMEVLKNPVLSLAEGAAVPAPEPRQAGQRRSPKRCKVSSELNIKEVADGHSERPDSCHFIPRKFLMLKCSPWLAEKEQTAFKEDNDGWMSGIVSRVNSTIPSRVGKNSKRGDVDVSAPYRVPIPLAVRVLGSSFLGEYCFRRGSAD